MLGKRISAVFKEGLLKTDVEINLTPSKYLTNILFRTPKNINTEFMSFKQGFSQDLETGRRKLTIIEFWGIMFSKGDKNILR